MHDESRVAFRLVPLEASEVGLFEFVVGLVMDVSVLRNIEAGFMCLIAEGYTPSS